MSKSKYMTTMNIRLAKSFKSETEQLKREYNISPTDYVKMALHLLDNCIHDKYVTKDSIIALHKNALEHDHFCYTDVAILDMKNDSDRSKKKARQEIDFALKIIKEDSKKDLR